MTRVIAKKNNFPRIAAAVGSQVASAINNGMNNLLLLADQTVPVDTGMLKANKTISYATSENPQASVTWNMDYAVPVHEGTESVAPRPWAREAADAITPELMDDLRSLEKGL